MHYIYTVLFLCIALISVPVTSNAALESPALLEGFAWSPNVGWINFGVGSDPVAINPSGSITGHAWSPHIGWVRFGGLTGCPTGSCAAKIDFNSNQVTGWARALNYSSGWDGWISLSAQNHGSAYYGYGMTLSSSETRPVTFTSFSYAWGADVLGWINYSRVAVDTPCTAKTECSVDGGAILDTDVWCEMATTTCAAEYICVPTSLTCEQNINFIAAEPIVVRAGDTTTVSWGTTPGLYTSCQVEGHSDSWTGLDNTGETTSPLGKNNTTYRLMCDGAEIERVEVQVIPSIYES